MPDNDPTPTAAQQQPEPAQQRAPLPGEPGFKAPLTKSQINRASQTVKGMFISVGLTIAIVLPVIFLNPGSNKETYQKRLDVSEVAQQTITTQNFKALSPDFKKGWYANKAEWNPGAADGVPYWELGIIGRPDSEDHYAQVLQANQANASWVALATDGSVPTGKSVSVDGQAWQEREQPGRKDAKTILTTKLDGYTYVLSADDGEDKFLKKTAKLVQDTAKDAKPAT